MQEGIAGAAGAAGVVVVVPLLVKAAKEIKYSYDKYGRSQIEEIREIRRDYKDVCWSLEKDHTLNTLYDNDVQKRSNENQETDFPVYLRTRNNDEIPELFYQKFCPVIDSEHWNKKVIKTSPLSYPIRQVIAYICEYQTERDKRLIGSGYSYDPTNLFFEELKCFMIRLSAHGVMDDKILNIVRARYKYIGEIYASGIFKPSNNDATRMEALQHIRGIFKNLIIPAIELALSRESAREHFSKFKQQVQDTMESSVKFLFYVFRDTKDTPLTFNLERIRYPNAVWKDAVSTYSGRWLHHLLCTNVMLRVFPSDRAASPVSSNETSLYSNPFMNVQGKVVNPLQHQQLDCSLGILSGFFEDKLTQRKFLELHGLIQKLGIFYLICEKLYELSGDGGNILVYGFALKQVDEILLHYKTLNSQIQEIINFLYEKAETYKATLMKAGDIKDGVAEWDKLFRFIYRTHSSLEDQLRESMCLVRGIEQKIIEVNSPGYQQEVKERLQDFCSLANYFSGKTQSLPHVSRSRSGGNFFPSASASSTPNPLPIKYEDEEIQEQLSPHVLKKLTDAVELYKDKQYLLAKALFSGVIHETRNWWYHRNYVSSLLFSGENNRVVAYVNKLVARDGDVPMVHLCYFHWFRAQANEANRNYDAVKEDYNYILENLRPDDELYPIIREHRELLINKLAVDNKYISLSK